MATGFWPRREGGNRWSRLILHLMNLKETILHEPTEDTDLDEDRSKKEEAYAEHLIFHILTATRLLIPRYWKTTAVPSKRELMILIDSNLTYEQMALRSNRRLQLSSTSMQMWKRWKGAYFFQDQT
ncbi:hypothetical protein XELAEV_18023491mg [Xenopus laevis]|uniref:Uncharacterized protein n=1 Tax=Xenopus laevis TaxID=8355 RepID=A0A974HPD3_XENLA|nr:hypothetical protein XELAEV_18023491mg [Xenopus laevis]